MDTVPMVDRMRLFILVLVRSEDKVLLGWRKYGFGAEMWDGFGGKTNPGETILQAAQRHLREQCRLRTKANHLQSAGNIRFTFGGVDMPLDLRIFTLTKFWGVPEETDEMRPRWFKIQDIPYRNMWPSADHWLPIILERQLFLASIMFTGRNFEVVCDQMLVKENNVIQTFRSLRS